MDVCPGCSRKQYGSDHLCEDCKNRLSPELWVVGKSLELNSDKWEFAGVFSTEALAINACIDHYYFIGPANLNEAHPHETCVWKGAYFPNPLPGYQNVQTT